MSGEINMVRIFSMTLVLCGVIVAAAGANADAATLAISDGTVFTLGSAGKLEHATVLVEDGKIKAVGTAVKIPSDARVIEAKGRIVTPGLMNSYTDLALDEIIENAKQTVDSRTEKGSTAASFDVRYGLNANSPALAVARIEGLTRAITAPAVGHSIFAGAGAEIYLGDGADVLATPRIAMFVDLTSAGREAAGGSRSAAWATMLSGLEESRRYDQNRVAYERGAQAPYSLKREELEALGPVVRGELPLAILANRESDIRNIIALKAERHLKIVLIGGAEAWRAAHELATAKIPVVLNPIDDLPGSFDRIGMTSSNAARLAKAGVMIAFYGSPSFDDGPYGVGKIAALAGIAVSNGVPWTDALEAMTANAARIWGIEAHYGTIEPGKDADLVVWDGDPLEPSSAPVSVLIRGSDIPLVSRQTELRDRYLKANPNHLPPAYSK